MSRYKSRPWSTGVQLLIFGMVIAVAWFSSNRGPGGSEEPDSSDDDVSAVVRQLTPDQTATTRDGIAAIVLMDVSGSMADPVKDGGTRRPKIEVARAAALDLIRQFDAYAKAHPTEPVLVGLMEFSGLDDADATREVIPLSPADPARAEQALARMQADGRTPIGDAMIAGKRALDATGLSRKHLLVVTDGENTNGPEPLEVMKGIATRPDTERPSVYFVAFDIAASRFSRVKDAGALVLPAANAQDLNATIDSLLTGKILVEGP